MGLIKFLLIVFITSASFNLSFAGDGGGEFSSPNLKKLRGVSASVLGARGAERSKVLLINKKLEKDVSSLRAEIGQLILESKEDKAKSLAAKESGPKAKEEGIKKIKRDVAFLREVMGKDQPPIWQFWRERSARLGKVNEVLGGIEKDLSDVESNSENENNRALSRAMKRLKVDKKFRREARVIRSSESSNVFKGLMK